jgi:cytochrome b561
VQGPPKGARLIDWLLNLLGYILAILVIASMFGGYVMLYERGKSIVMFFVNMPRDIHATITEAKEHLLPDNKLPTNEASRDDKE